jgi:prepilin-type N-terminal cleavage/methylation domain-containing protein
LSERRAGFTLIELVVAVAILGLSMTIVFLKVDTLLPGSRLKAACKNVVTNLEHLRSQAIFSGVPIYLEYHIDTDCFRAYFPVVFDEENKVMGAGETEIFETTPVGDTIAIEDVVVGYYDGKRSDPGRQTIFIRPDGSLTGHIVHLKNTERGDEMSVRIASLTGFAEILKGRVEYENVRDDSF